MSTSANPSTYVTDAKMMLDSTPEQNLRGADCFTFVSLQVFSPFSFVGSLTTAGSYCWSASQFIALFQLTRMKVPVMPRGLLLALSGILAREILGFRDVFLLWLFVHLHRDLAVMSWVCCVCFARSNSSAHKLLNLTGAHMSSWRCLFVVSCVALFGFFGVLFACLLCCFSFPRWSPPYGHVGLCAGPCSLLIPQ